MTHQYTLPKITVLMGGMFTSPKWFPIWHPHDNIIWVFLKIGDPQVTIGFNPQIIQFGFQQYVSICNFCNLSADHISGTHGGFLQWGFPGSPKSSIFIGFSLINHPAVGVIHSSGNPHYIIMNHYLPSLIIITPP